MPDPNPRTRTTAPTRPAAITLLRKSPAGDGDGGSAPEVDMPPFHRMAIAGLFRHGEPVVTNGANRTLISVRSRQRDGNIVTGTTPDRRGSGRGGRHSRCREVECGRGPERAVSVACDCRGNSG